LQLSPGPPWRHSHEGAPAPATNRIDTQRHDAPELSAYGDYKVGVRTLEMVNSDQIDILAIDPAADKARRMAALRPAR
jgi:hypothetical protein